MNTDGFGTCADKLDSMLPILPQHRDAKGAWRRFPFFFTLLALVEMNRPLALTELRYTLPECEKKLKRLSTVGATVGAAKGKQEDVHTERKIAVLERVLDVCG